jgi:hypothetical protein
VRARLFGRCAGDHWPIALPALRYDHVTMPSAVFARLEEASVGKEPIRYACERCKSERVLVTPRSLGPRAWVRARLLTVARSLRLDDSTPSSFAEIRAEMLVKAEDDAFRSFTGHFRFCHECRRFVCSGCWSRSREKCKSCLAREARQAGPGHGRLWSNLGMTVVGVVFLVVLSFGSVLAAYNLPPIGPIGPIGPARPAQAAPTASAFEALTPGGAQTHGGAGSNGASTMLPNASSTPSEASAQTQPGSPAASGPAASGPAASGPAASGPAASKTVSTGSGSPPPPTSGTPVPTSGTPVPTSGTPVPTPTPIPSYETDPDVQISCASTSNAAPLTVNCKIQGNGYDEFIWLLDGVAAAAPPYVLSAGRHTIQARILRGGTWRLSNVVVVG